MKSYKVRAEPQVKQAIRRFAASERGFMRRWRVQIAALCIGTMLLITGCDGGTHRAIGSSSAKCPLTAKLVPACGVLWGVATRPHQANDVQDLEKQVGRTFDFVYRYHDLNDVIPDDAEREVASQGRYLHLSIGATDFSAADRHAIKWADIAEGKYDELLRQQGAGIASLKNPVFVTFDHEANQPVRQARGTGEDFKRAWRHVRDVYTNAGATNAVWVWVMMGSEKWLTRAGELWPGNQFVDWISWDVYNQSGCRGKGITVDQFVSFPDKMLIFYDWVHSHGPQIGMDPNKPMMISEAGSAQYSNDPQRTADWYSEIPGVLKKYPQIRALAIWDSRNGACDYRVQQDPAILKSVREAGLDPWINAGVPRAPSPGGVRPS